MCFLQCSYLHQLCLLRNKISHEYFGVDYEIIWDVAVNYLPENKKEIEVTLKYNWYHILH
ncbi:MAG: HepT-like ribonuclease domain-containing protein [Bacteroidales bacterium]|nr:HepT-like ribonuclease domain-containing protein [Bacteroidales bacterium]